MQVALDTVGKPEVVAPDLTCVSFIQEVAPSHRNVVLFANLKLHDLAFVLQGPLPLKHHRLIARILIRFQYLQTIQFGVDYFTILLRAPPG